MANRSGPNSGVASWDSSFDRTWHRTRSRCQTQPAKTTHRARDRRRGAGDRRTGQPRKRSSAVGQLGMFLEKGRPAVVVVVGNSPESLLAVELRDPLE